MDPGLAVGPQAWSYQRLREKEPEVWGGRWGVGSGGREGREDKGARG